MHNPRTANLRLLALAALAACIMSASGGLAALAPEPAASGGEGAPSEALFALQHGGAAAAEPGKPRPSASIATVLPGTPVEQGPVPPPREGQPAPGGWLLLTAPALREPVEVPPRALEPAEAEALAARR